MIDIDFPSIPTAGDEFTFTCTATVPERLVPSPSGFIISYNTDIFNIREVVVDNPNATQSSLMRNGNVFSRDITLNPVKTSDAREYFCVVVFSSLGVIATNNRMLRVTSKSFVYIHISYLIFSYPFCSTQYPLLSCH